MSFRRSGVDNPILWQGNGTFGSADQLYLRQPNNNNLHFQTNGGNTRMLITGSGNVGIGTTSPGAKLEVLGDTYLRTQLFTDTIRPYSADQLTLLNGNNNYLYINGNVGIGTASPATKLHVVGTAETRLRVGSSNASSNVVLELRDENTPTGQGTVITYNNATGETYFNNAMSTATTDFHFQSGEYGTANDFFTLSNSGGNAILHLKTTGGDSFITYENATNELAVASDGDLRLTTPTDQDVFFISSGGNIETTQAGGSVSMGGDLVVDGDITGNSNAYITGNVGIGTTNPSTKLHVYSASPNPTIVGKFENPNGQSIVEIQSKNNTLGILQFGDPQDGNPGAIQYDHSGNSMRFKTGDGERVRITSTGNVGIGTTNMELNWMFLATLELAHITILTVTQVYQQHTGGSYI